MMEAVEGEQKPAEAEEGMEMPNEPLAEDDALLDEPANEESYEEEVFDEEEAD